MAVIKAEIPARDQAGPATLILRFADVGVATYGTLRVVADPARTVVWVLDESALAAVDELLAATLPVPVGEESTGQAVRRALTTGSFVEPNPELEFARGLGSLLPDDAWNLLSQCLSEPRATLYVTPTARLARIPFAILAVPAAVSSGGDGPHGQAYRLMEMADVVMALPAGIAAAQRSVSRWADRRDDSAVLILDPRIPGQRPDSPLGSVLGRPSPDMPLARHFADQPPAELRPYTSDPVELFRRSDTDRRWLSEVLQSRPSRLLFVGHAGAAPGDAGYAERAAIHLSCSASGPGYADAVGEHRPFTAADILGDIDRWPMPPRIAMVACESGGDLRFDEATGMVAAMVLAGAETVTATLWPLPTTAGYRQWVPGAGIDAGDPMTEMVIAVDTAHRADDAVRALGRWQRAQMRRWRSGDLRAHPIYWGAMATFSVGRL
ncbi:CHAT domain-containing protein [Williamsia sp.]|uniref:CHAT domain-containing protein n=1 Tax=Williamsia sp. TaxID=1872085 RepID=UPI002F9330E2